MQPSTPPDNCPTCKSPIPADAPGGLCPACTLEKAATVSYTATGGRRSAPPSIEEIAPHFPELEILELLGAGGMGVVYKVRQPQLDRTVALKILSRELTQEPAFVERFNREAKVLARLSHPNIVAVFDFGTAGPYNYLLMEYVDGVNLRQAMRTGGFKPAEALALVQDVCAALQFAHEEGILHRDIKPENVLIDSKGRVKIADFGIAKLVGGGESSDVTLTLQGSILGSPHYMAPEQIETPGDVDQRADIYSLGVVLYEMLTGELPIGRFALPSQKAAMDARIDEIVLRTLEKEREARFQSAEEVSTSVGALAHGNPTASSPAPAATPDNERPAARFSLSSALLTGASLVLFVVFLVAMDLLEPFSMAKPARIAQDYWSLVSTMILAILPAILGALAGICGFILGASALAQVRKSQGQKEGLGFAVFAVAAWPIILLFLFTSLFLATPMPGSDHSVGWGLVTLLCGLPYLIAVVWFIRALIHWGGGVERSTGERYFPSLGRALLPPALFSILGPVLMVITPMVLPSVTDYGPYEEAMAEMRKEESRLQEIMTHSSTDDQVRWRLGKPEVVVPLAVRRGQKMSLQLVLRDEQGEITWTEDLGELESPPGADLEKAVLKVGTFLKSDDRKGSLHALAAVRTGWNACSIRSIEDLRGWTFETEFPNELSFDTPTARVLGIATSDKVGPEGARGVLTLEVDLTETDPPGKLPGSR